MPYEYLRDPAAIYRRSFELIREESDLSHLPSELHTVALRLVHAVADPTILADLVWSDGAGKAGQAALSRGAPGLVDAQKGAYGLIKKRLAPGNAGSCPRDGPARVALRPPRKTARPRAPP